MQKQYNHLNTEERVTLMLMRRQGESLRAIASVLNRSPSTLSRELQRNNMDSNYDVHIVNAQARERRHQPRRQRKLSASPQLWQIVTEMLAKRWSPQQITAKLKANWPVAGEPRNHLPDDLCLSSW